MQRYSKNKKLPLDTYNVAQRGHIAESARVRPPLGRAAALPPHGAKSPGSARDAYARAQPAREKPARKIPRAIPLRAQHVPRRQPRVQST
ncbi:unnamed protein product [Parnassius apollo]|uniref:(apollo) hypothetical protein n=1 Tax=Parnassius apollo TaxID=110799 RepID=A0A8S3W3Z1_PARAO|nr:unnamed protein product [Parnassius apollo]